MRLLSTFVALALSVSTAMAGDLKPLSPGAPAGVKQAQQEGDNALLYGVLGAGAVAVIAFVISNGGHTTLSPVVAQSTSSTSGTAP